MFSFIKDIIQIIFDKLLMSDIVFNYKAKSLINGLKFGKDDTVKFCKEELNYLTKERLVKTKNRKMANYFMELSKSLDYTISPQHFKKFYNYLTINNDSVLLSESNKKKLKSSNRFFKSISIVLICFYLLEILMLILSERFISACLYSVIMFIFIAFCTSFIINKQEIEDFEKTINKFNENKT